mmetsp:Transcript_27512/g.60789  ORF Transcript_27512/g.60789 Transcript_27512/m.60789 type:complete len:224 (-) Transcript_27512:423-1094(-)
MTQNMYLYKITTMRVKDDEKRRGPVKPTQSYLILRVQGQFLYKVWVLAQFPSVLVLELFSGALVFEKQHLHRTKVRSQLLHGRIKPFGFLDRPGSLFPGLPVVALGDKGIVGGLDEVQLLVFLDDVVAEFFLDLLDGPPGRHHHGGFLQNNLSVDDLDARGTGRFGIDVGAFGGRRRRRTRVVVLWVVGAVGVRGAATGLVTGVVIVVVVVPAHFWSLEPRTK